MPRKRLYGKMKYSEALGPELIDMMRKGKDLSVVCRDWGIGRETLRNWVRKYPEFRRAYEIAETALLASKEELTAKISKTGVGNAGMHQFYLKSKFPDDYRDKREVGFTDRDGNDVDLGAIDRRQLARALAATLIEVQRETIDITPNEEVEEELHLIEGGSNAD
jgi:hypothetical protein